MTLDLIGPLPRSLRGHTWVLNMQDRFTKWLEIRPLRRATAESTEPPSHQSAPARRTVPKVGTTIQRSDAAQRRKAIWLAETPPPLPKRGRRSTEGYTARPASGKTASVATNTPPIVKPRMVDVATQTSAEPTPQLQPAGPTRPPPIPVEIWLGMVVPIPHYAVHKNRKYRADVQGKKYVLRFNANGTLRSSRPA
ncbi:hypothetical protein P5V15_011457 [Pogonomyrmex californicus]